MPTLTPEQAPPEEQLSFDGYRAKPEQQLLNMEIDDDAFDESSINQVKDSFRHIATARDRAERLSAGIGDRMFRKGKGHAEYEDARDDYLKLYKTYLEQDEKLTPEQRLLIKNEEDKIKRETGREVKLGYLDIEQELLDARMDLAKISAKLGHRTSREGNLHRKYEMAREKYMLVFEAKLGRDKVQMWEQYKLKRKAELAQKRLNVSDEDLEKEIVAEEITLFDAAANASLEGKTDGRERLKRYGEQWEKHKAMRKKGIKEQRVADLTEKELNELITDEELSEELSEEEIISFDKELQEFTISEAIRSAKIVADVRIYLMQNYSRTGQFINWYNSKPRWAKIAVGAGVTTAIFMTPGIGLGVAALAAGGTKAARGTLGAQKKQLTLEESQRRMADYVEEYVKKEKMKLGEAQRRSINSDLEYDIDRNRRSVAWGAAGVAVGTTVSLALNVADEVVEIGGAPTGESIGREIGQDWSSPEHVASVGDTTGEAELMDIDQTAEPELVPNTDSNIEVENTTPDSEPETSGEVSEETPNEIEYADDIESELAEIDPHDNPWLSARGLAPGSQEQLMQQAIDIYAENNDLGMAQIEHPSIGSAYATFDGVEWNSTMWPEINEILISLAETR